MPFYVRQIDYVVLTHPHADHLNGLIEVLKRYQVGCVYLTGVKYSSAAYQKFLEVLAEQNIPIVIADSSKDFQLDQVSFDIVYPLKSLQSRVLENANDGSVAMRVIFGKTELMLSGDLGISVEDSMIASGEVLQADIFKAAHHGSAGSNSWEFLRAVGPELVVISVGLNNSYHHPAPAALQRFSGVGAGIFRTDKDGMVEVESAGAAEFFVKKAGKTFRVKDEE